MATVFVIVQHHNRQQSTVLEAKTDKDQAIAHAHKVIFESAGEQLIDMGRKQGAGLSEIHINLRYREYPHWVISEVQLDSHKPY